MVTGEGLDPWSRIPSLISVKLTGRFLGANRQARDAYAAMQNDPTYQHPISYASVDASDYAGVLLPGGMPNPYVPTSKAATLNVSCAIFWHL